MFEILLQSKREEMFRTSYLAGDTGLLQDSNTIFKTSSNLSIISI